MITWLFWFLACGEAHGGAKLLTSWWPGSREREKKRERERGCVCVCVYVCVGYSKISNLETLCTPVFRIISLSSEPFFHPFPNLLNWYSSVVKWTPKFYVVLRKAALPFSKSSLMFGKVFCVRSLNSVL
jgi:hypothetical protein